MTKEGKKFDLKIRKGNKIQLLVGIFTRVFRKKQKCLKQICRSGNYLIMCLIVKIYFEGILRPTNFCEGHFKFWCLPPEAQTILISNPAYIGIKIFQKFSRFQKFLRISKMLRVARWIFKKMPILDQSADSPILKGFHDFSGYRQYFLNP